MTAATTVCESGQVCGISVGTDVSAFLGLPYAAPPVGSLRWRPPEKPASWSGVREANSFGPDPIQPAGLRTSRAPGMSEDCLYLNVWMPRQRQEGGWPVMVWSCGGAFTMGSGAFVEEDPAKLAARGAVIVTFNIRLNIFGFLAHPALSAESPHASSGNYGLLDQAEAFAWIRRNIASFGGDPDRVTFFGQSAGATVGMLLLSSPMITRLPYDRAIFQSPGSFSALLPLEEAEQHGAPLGDTTEEIRSVDADQLLGRARQLPAVQPSLWLARPLRPIADGWVIPSTEPMTSGHFRPVPAIIGINEDEGAFFGPRMNVRTTDDYVRFVTGIFGDDSIEALERYPVASDEDVPAMFSAVYGDRGFTYPIDELARAFVGGGADVYRYVYAYRHGAIGRAPTHSEEIGVLLDNMPHTQPEDAAMAEQMANYWLAFAEAGDPNHAGAVNWPRLDTATGQYLRLDCPLTQGAHWRSEFARFVAENRAD